jgi:hypothetical protein
MEIQSWSGLHPVGTAMRYGLDAWGFLPGRSRLALGSTQSLIQWVLGALAWWQIAQAVKLITQLHTEQNGGPLS